MPEQVQTAVPSAANSTEYKVAKTGQIISLVLIALGGALEALSTNGVALPAWVGLVAMLIGALKGVFTQSVYTASRTAVKVAAAGASTITVGTPSEAVEFLRNLSGKANQ